MRRVIGYVAYTCLRSTDVTVLINQSHAQWTRHSYSLASKSVRIFLIGKLRRICIAIDTTHHNERCTTQQLEDSQQWQRVIKPIPWLRDAWRRRAHIQARTPCDYEQWSSPLVAYRQSLTANNLAPSSTHASRFPITDRAPCKLRSERCEVSNLLLLLNFIHALIA